METASAMTLLPHRLDYNGEVLNISMYEPYKDYRRYFASLGGDDETPGSHDSFRRHLTRQVTSKT